MINFHVFRNDNMNHNDNIYAFNIFYFENYIIYP